MKNQFKKNIIIAWIGCILTGMSFSMVIPFLPLLIKSIGVSEGQLKMYSSMAISVTALATIIAANFWGRTADKIGKKKVMVIAATGTVIVMAGLSLSRSIVSLLFFRILSGSLQGYIPYATVLIASEANQKNKAKILSFLATGLLIGNFIGPFIGGFVGDLYGVRCIFIISSLIASICMLITLFGINEKSFKGRVYHKKTIRKLISEINKPLYLLGLLGTSFIFRLCTMSINPLIILYMFQINSEILNNLKLSGAIISLSSLSSIILFPFVGKLYGYISVGRVLTIGLLIQASALLFLANTQNFWQLGTVFILIGVAQQMIVPSISSEITKISPVDSCSRIFSFNVIAQNIGQVIGPLLGAWVVGKFNFNTLFYLLSVITLLMTVGLSQLVKYEKNA